jgi:hypothetical protein
MPDQRSDRRDAVELKTKSVSQISSRAIIATGFPISIGNSRVAAWPLSARNQNSRQSAAEGQRMFENFANLNDENTPSGLGRLPIPPAARASECARVWNVRLGLGSSNTQLASEKSRKRRCGRPRLRGTPRFGELTGLGTLRRDPHVRASAYEPIAACGARRDVGGCHLSREDCGLQRAGRLDHVPLLMLGRSIYLGHQVLPGPAVV